METDVVRVFDTTLRDGEQSPGATLNIDEKLEIARLLVRLGVDVIEAGFPIASPGDFEAVRRVALEVGGGESAPIIAGLARASRADIERAWEAVRPARHPRIGAGLHRPFQAADRGCPEPCRAAADRTGC